MKNLLLLCLLIFSIPVTAQNEWKCASPQARMPVNGHPVGKPLGHSRSDSATIYIPLTLNFVGTDEGTGYYPFLDMLESVCSLQLKLNPVNLQVYIEGLPHYINSSAFYDMSPDYFSSNEMFAFIENHNTPNTLNVYAVKDAQGAAFASFRDFDYDNSTYPPIIHNPQNHSVVLGEDFLSGNAPAFAHEVGHYLGLWHTFNGWEGIDYLDYAGDIPDTLFWTGYDPVEDTSYVLPWLVEYADQSNCLISGDLICDTPPDYFSYGYGCNGDQESNNILTDPNGLMFRADGSNYMSYSYCVKDKFTEEQREWMRDVAQGPRSYLLYDQSEPTPYIVDSVSFIYPPNGSIVEVSDSLTLEWGGVAGADYYMLEFGRKLSSTFYFPIIKEKVLDQTSFKVAVNDQYDYYWKVWIMDKHDFCGYVFDTSYFNAAPLSGFNEFNKAYALSLFPNPVSGDLYWQVPGDNSFQSIMKLDVYDANGQLLSSIKSVDKNLIQTASLPEGIYFLKLITDNKVFVGRFIKKL